MITTIIRRNLKLFYRDKAGVFFSLLGPLIMFVLYSFFLGNTERRNIIHFLPNSSLASVDFFINSWVFAGILVTTTITTSFAAMQVFVADRVNERFKDFAVSPITRSNLVIGYLGSTLIISLLMTTVVFAIGEAYILMSGGQLLSAQNAIVCYGTLVLLCGLFSAVAGLVVTFIRSVAAFTSLSVILGTVSGFLAAVYVPIGTLPINVANFINALPFSQVAALVRSSFVTQAVSKLTDTSQASSQIEKIYGVYISIGDYRLPNVQLVLIAVGLMLTAAILAIARINKQLK